MPPESKHNNPPALTALGDYWLSEEIVGRGSNSTVHLGFQRTYPGKRVAIKVVRKKDLAEEKRREIEQEIKTLRVVQTHPSIVQLLHVYDTEDSIFLIFEHKTCDLYSYIRKHRPIPEQNVRFIFTQLLSALEYCHALGICHRDVKIENILIDEQTLEVSLCDFGFATFFQKGERLNKWCGSPHTVAPEIILRQPYEPSPIDVWAAGSVLYAMLCGTFPFQEKTFREIFQRTTMGMYHRLPSNVSPQAQNLISGMLRVDPEQRLTFEQIRSHPWMRGTTQ